MTASDGHKQRLREELLSARLRLSPAERQARSRQAAERLVAHPAFLESRTVALYAALGAEADPSTLARAGQAAGKRTLYPRLAPGSRVLTFAACSPEDLVAGGRGTREPPASAPEVPLEEVDLIVVPGVGYDATGARLGRGGGYYDATLARVPARAVRAAIAFELQLVACVPHEPHDARVDLVATEARLVEAPSSRSLTAPAPAGGMRAP